jgi:hypothetical protein
VAEAVSDFGASVRRASNEVAQAMNPDAY